MSFPAKTKEIEIRGNKYKVTYPNNRGLIAIFSRKAQLSKEQYDVLSFGLDGNSRYAALLIDAIATFEQIMPNEFLKDINISSLLEGDVIVGAEIVKVYRDHIEDWFGAWSKAISDVLNPQADTKKEEDKKHA